MEGQRPSPPGCRRVRGLGGAWGRGGTVRPGAGAARGLRLAWGRGAASAGVLPSKGGNHTCWPRTAVVVYAEAAVGVPAVLQSRFESSVSGTGEVMREQVEGEESGRKGFPAGSV